MRAPTETVKSELGSPLTVYQLLGEEVVRHKLNIHRGLLQTLSIIGGKFCSTRRPAMLGCASWRLAASWPVFLPTSTKRRASRSQFAVDYKDTGHSKQLMPLTEPPSAALVCIQRKVFGLLACPSKGPQRCNPVGVKERSIILSRCGQPICKHQFHPCTCGSIAPIATNRSWQDWSFSACFSAAITSTTRECEMIPSCNQSFIGSTLAYAHFCFVVKTPRCAKTRRVASRGLLTELPRRWVCFCLHR